MPLPEGFEPIETKGVQKRQETDTVIITKSGDIYICLLYTSPSPRD